MTPEEKLRSRVATHAWADGFASAMVAVVKLHEAGYEGEALRDALNEALSVMIEDYGIDVNAIFERTEEPPPLPSKVRVQ